MQNIFWLFMIGERLLMSSYFLAYRNMLVFVAMFEKPLKVA